MSLLKTLVGYWSILRGTKKQFSEEHLQTIIMACVQIKLGQIHKRNYIYQNDEELHLELMKMFVEIVGHDYLNVKEITKASETFKLWIPKLIDGKLI